MCQLGEAGHDIVVCDSLFTDRAEAVLYGMLIDSCSSKNKTFARYIFAIAMFANEGIRFKRVSHKRTLVSDLKKGDLP